MKNTVLWLSRHPMTDIQKKDLEDSVFGGEEVSVVSENLTWTASGVTNTDIIANKKMWEELLKKSHIICGVIPPVALEASMLVKEQFAILCPVSKQDKKIREDGNVQIDFVHLRWAKIR